MYITKKEDGFWLIVESKGKHAMVNLGFPKNIVGDVIAEAAQHSETYPLEIDSRAVLVVVKQYDKTGDEVSISNINIPDRQA